MSPPKLHFVAYLEAPMKPNRRNLKRETWPQVIGSKTVARMPVTRQSFYSLAEGNSNFQAATWTLPKITAPTMVPTIYVIPSIVFTVSVNIIVWYLGVSLP